LRIFGDVVGQELQGHKAAELHVLGFVDDTHATTAEFFDDAVVRDDPADERLGFRHLALILGRAKRQVNEWDTVGLTPVPGNYEEKKRP
jgi:hypothetical protein